MHIRMNGAHTMIIHSSHNPLTAVVLQMATVWLMTSKAAGKSFNAVLAVSLLDRHACAHLHIYGSS